VASGIIQLTLLLIAMGLALLPFFEFFRGTPHQLAAIKELEQSVPEELLEEDADWFQAWKESGYDQQVFMPYFKQLDNKTGTGYRECFSSAVLVGWLHAGNMLRGEPPMCSGLGCGHWSVISGYAGKNSNDPEWIMQDPRGYPEMEKGGHSNPHLGRNVRVRQAAFYQRWQAEGPRTGWVILVNE
jgi:hypothetical protein